MRPVLWRSILLSLCVALLPATSHAQNIAKTLDELRLLVKVGDTISVTDSGGRISSGPITTLAPSALVMNVGGQPREWQEGEIATISHRRADSLGNGALWGLVVGASSAAIGILLAANSEGGSLDSEDAGFVALAIGLYGGIGAGVGVGIDALVRKEQVIYRKAGTASARYQVAPFMTPRAHGARFSVRF